MYIRDNETPSINSHCIIVNKYTGEKFDDESNTIGTWFKFINDWRVIK